MTIGRSDLAHAETEAALAKARFAETLDLLKERVNPRIRAAETWAELRLKGREAGDDALEFAYEKPRIAAGLAGVALLLILRRPIARLFRWPFSRRRSKWDTPPQKPIAQPHALSHQRGDRS